MLRLWVLFLCLWSFGVTAGPRICVDISVAAYESHVLQQFRASVRGVQTSRPKLEWQDGKGILDTSAFFPQDVMEGLRPFFPEGNLILYSRQPRVGKYASEGVVFLFQPYIDWLLETVNASLPFGERVALRNVELRHALEQSQGPKSWHIDGGDYTALVTFVGQGTEYLPLIPEARAYTVQQYLDLHSTPPTTKQVPRGHTLVFSGDNRSPGLPHRTPDHFGARWLLLFHFVRI